MHERMEDPTPQLADGEYYSLMRLKEALKRVPMYKCSMQKLKVNWIGLKLSPPLILGMLEGRREEEQEQWKEIDRKVGFYGKLEQTTTEARDDRKVNKAINDEEIDSVSQRMSNTFSRG